MNYFVLILKIKTCLILQTLMKLEKVMESAIFKWFCLKTMVLPFQAFVSMTSDNWINGS